MAVLVAAARTCAAAVASICGFCGKENYRIECMLSVQEDAQPVLSNGVKCRTDFWRFYCQQVAAARPGCSEVVCSFLRLSLGLARF